MLQALITQEHSIYVPRGMRLIQHSICHFKSEHWHLSFCSAKMRRQQSPTIVRDENRLRPILAAHVLLYGSPQRQNRRDYEFNTSDR